LVSGKQVEVGMLFSQRGKLLRAVGASIIFSVAVGVGLVLLVVPGIYLMLRYGQYMNAIVDKDLGIMAAFEYSSSITTNNRLTLFVLALLSLAIFIVAMLVMWAGININVLLALPVGLIFGYLLIWIWLSWMVGYRWMQYGRRAVEDLPGTTTPALA
jgi:hypothetical protein